MHISVLPEEVVEYLRPRPNHNYIDCTFGFGGHSQKILEENKPTGQVLGIEGEKEVILINGKKDWDKRLTLVHGNFIDLDEIAKANNFSSVDGILLDLGLSSWQIDESGRGFTFQKDEPLLMNFSGNEFTAEELINSWSCEEIARVIQEYGEEKKAFWIAKQICLERKKERIQTTFQLVEILKKVLGDRKGKIHIATKTFQALRIAVNNELDNLEIVLEKSFNILNQNGRLVVISFHALEDRIVKNFFRDKKKEGKLKILTKKPVTPSPLEIGFNYRSRSAKLRAIEKT